jgi:hypothetical protein
MCNKSKYFLLSRKRRGGRFLLILFKMSKNLRMSFSAVTRLAEGLLTLKVENSLVCLVGTRIPAVYVMEWRLFCPGEN